jgi:methylmalonyl-CoA mutase N-terminal domain/subunit
VEALGGMGAAIESGMAKRRTEEAATRKQARWLAAAVAAPG